MPTSSRFAVAVHVLAAIALHEGEPVNSEKIAGSASTNPAVIRRLLSMLAEAGLVRARLGQGGGALLARAPAKISLLDVYCAVENESLFALHRQPPDPNCFVGRHIQPVLCPVLDRAERGLEAELRRVSIADIARSVNLRLRRQPVPRRPARRRAKRSRISV